MSEYYECPVCGWYPDTGDEKHLVSRSLSWAVSNAEGEDRYDWEEIWSCPHCETEFSVIRSSSFYFFTRNF